MPIETEIRIKETTRTQHSPIGAPMPYKHTSKSISYTFPEQSLITEIHLTVSDQHPNITIAISVKNNSVETFKERFEKTESKYGPLLSNKFCFTFKGIKQNPDEQNRLWQLLRTAHQLSPVTFNIFESIADNLQIPTPSIPSLTNLSIKTIDENPELSQQAQVENTLPEELAKSLTPPEKQHAFPASFEEKYINEKVNKNQSNTFVLYL